MSAAVLGQAAVIRHVLVALLADGHVLLESLPGLAKTRTVKALAAHLDATMRRIQFTPDLLPSDITGADVLQQDAEGRQRIEFQQGPLFGNRWPTRSTARRPRCNRPCWRRWRSGRSRWAG
ncbi:Uncharacterized conserved protein (some members contain a von Willebrand factor type A (vWA) domain) [Bordetella parapertussis]|nr:Uncharacterized conserved protein (some members contain a von Willebrand factor type A (vWA) domain) [Bordetella parapertussis]SUV56428.1 Uncharacterized conserved protein (some members contain a von Willebrand factor type A (vWA) domain) [Bordetella parapertussis]SUV77735.1 regulatory protein [Bordetella parapertussis]VEF53873.1 Uncharacterized conserved protein (some members contain a von Willebrand factor type A (vWA) domain) [Bordetella parapertussis]VTR37918.1 Uncharacterized conserved 